MSAPVEMIGKKFGRLKVIYMIGSRVNGRHPNWQCICECGNQCVKTSVALRNGREPSCGCAARDFQRKKHDITGEKFGRLLVLSASEFSTTKRQILWNCICNCGNETLATGSQLRLGQKKSCGCLRVDAILSASTKHGHTKKGKFSPTYVSWYSMKTRTTNKNIKNWIHYGGREIAMCERWNLFDNFLLDMGERPEGTSIDRIDVNGNYEPSNCRWADKTQQALNKRGKNE